MSLYITGLYRVKLLDLFFFFFFFFFWQREWLLDINLHQLVVVCVFVGGGGGGSLDRNASKLLVHKFYRPWLFLLLLSETRMQVVMATKTRSANTKTPTNIPMTISEEYKVTAWTTLYYIYNVNWGHVVCSLYRGSLYLGESVMGGSTVWASTYMYSWV